MTAQRPSDRRFPIGVLLTLASEGIQTDCTFGQLHEAITFVLGREVWTHELAEKQPWQRAASLILRQHPELGKYAAAIRPETRRTNESPEIVCRLELHKAKAELGDELVIRRGEDTRTESPLASLRRVAPGKPVIVVDPNEEPND